MRYLLLAFGLVMLLLLNLSSTAKADEINTVTKEVPMVTAEEVAEGSISEHFDYHKRGIRYRFTREGRVKPLYVDLEGPVHHGTSPGFRVVVRF